MSAREDSNATAVALRYAHGDAAPVVVAKGRGLLAEEIIRRARDAGVFVHESRDLVALLMQVDLDRHIPPGLFVAVAQLLAWIYHVETAAAARTAIRDGKIERDPNALTDARRSAPRSAGS